MFGFSVRFWILLRRRPTAVLSAIAAGNLTMPRLSLESSARVTLLSVSSTSTELALMSSGSVVTAGWMQGSHNDEEKRQLTKYLQF